MTIGVFTSTFQPMFKNDGSINAAGTLQFYEPGQVGSTAKVVYSDYLLTTSLGSTITLDSNGRKVIYLNGDYDLIEKDSTGATIVTRSNINPDQTSTVSEPNLTTNGSFETNSNNVPSDWTLFEWNAGANVVDSTDQAHGKYSMKFVSTGSGGGHITSNSFIAVNEGNIYELEFSLKSSDAGVRNIVQILWYDKDQVALGTPSTTLLDDATTNPTSWTRYLKTIIPISGALWAKLKFIGCDSTDATVGNTRYDDVILRKQDRDAPTGTVIDFGSSTVPLGYVACDGTLYSTTNYTSGYPTLYAKIGTSWGSGSGTFAVPDYRGRVGIGSGTGTLAETVLEANWTNSGGALTAAVTSNNSAWITGMIVQMTTTGTLPTGLALATDYYIIRVDTVSVKFATSLANALAGTAIAWTDDGTGNHTLTHTLITKTFTQKLGQDRHSLTSAETGPHTHTYGGITAGSFSNTDNAGAVAENTSLTSGSAGSGTAHNILQPSLVVTKCIKY